MNARLRAVDRAEAARDAARSWRDAGAIDGTAFASIERVYPDDRVRSGRGVRILLFAFTSIVAIAGFWLAYEIFVPRPRSGTILGILLMVFGAGLALATELQLGRMKRWRAGTEEATAFLSVAYIAMGAASVLGEWGAPRGHHHLETAMFGITALVCAAAAWRWGFWLMSAGAGIFLLAALARVGGGRWIWAVVGLLAAPLLVRLGASPAAVPSHRRCATASLVVALGALYAAVSIDSLDHQTIEVLGGRVTLWSTAPAPPGPPSLPRLLCIAATALLPVVLLAWGTRIRRRALILPGIVLGALSITTLHNYLELLPGWAALALGGGAAIGSALLIRRWLDAGPGQERGGFTAEPLFEGGASRRAIEIAAAAAAFSPAASVHQEPEFKPGGGSAGGAGAGGEYR